MLFTVAALAALALCSIATAQTVDDDDIATSLLQRYWPGGKHRADVQFFHRLDSRNASAASALPWHLAAQPHPPFVTYSEWRWGSHSPYWYAISQHELLSPAIEPRLVPCRTAFYLVLPALLQQPEPAACESWMTNCTADTDESQPPLWSFRHPLRELRKHAPSLRLIRSFVLGSERDKGLPPLPASFDSAAVWELESDMPGIVNVLHLVSASGRTIRINLTTSTHDWSSFSLKQPSLSPRSVKQHLLINRVSFSPFTYTFFIEPPTRARDRQREWCKFTALQPPAVCLNLSASSRHFRWQLPILTPITLYLPRDRRLWSGENQAWSVLQCGNRSLTSRAPSLHLLYQHEMFSVCVHGPHSRAADPLVVYEVWHLLGMMEGHNRLELQYHAPQHGHPELDWYQHQHKCWMDNRPAEPDVLLEIDFYDPARSPRAISNAAPATARRWWWS